MVQSGGGRRGREGERKGWREKPDPEKDVTVSNLSVIFIFQPEKRKGPAVSQLEQC